MTAALPRIVVIEDHGLVRQLLAELVRERLHFQVVGQGSSVAEGLAICLREVPDLAIVDWMLPDGRGFEIIRQAGARLSRTKWLMISANALGHVVRESVQLGVQGFVLKRSDLSTFQFAITRLLAGESYYCPESSRLLVDAIRSESQSLATNLTPREREILRAFASGENPKSIAERLGTSSKTVSNQLTSLKEKLGIFEPAALARYAIKHGYVDAP